MTVGHGPNDFNPIAAMVELIFRKGETLTYREMDERFVDLLEVSGISEADVIDAYTVWVYYMSNEAEKSKLPRPTQAQEAAMVRAAKQAMGPCGPKH